MYQVWTLSFPVRDVPAINQEIHVAEATIQLRGRQIVPDIDLDPTAAATGKLGRLDVQVIAPPAIAPAKRGKTTQSMIGSYEMPSPHQVTIWPAFIEARVEGY
jgi:hypothetical protein